MEDMIKNPSKYTPTQLWDAAKSLTVPRGTGCTADTKGFLRHTLAKAACWRSAIETKSSPEYTNMCREGFLMAKDVLDTRGTVRIPTAAEQYVAQMKYIRRHWS